MQYDREKGYKTAAWYVRQITYGGWRYCAAIENRGLSGVSWRIYETYASQEAYKFHIASEHFQKYKQGTLHMVKTLVLSDQMPLNPANCINNFIQ